MRSIIGIQILILALGLAIVGFTWSADPAPAPTAAAPAIDSGSTCSSAAQTPALAELTPGGQQCGSVICRVGTHCCNPTCSHCTPKGVECTQQTCD